MLCPSVCAFLTLSVSDSVAEKTKTKKMTLAAVAQIVGAAIVLSKLKAHISSTFPLIYIALNYMIDAVCAKCSVPKSAT